MSAVPDDASRLADLAAAYDFDAPARDKRELLWRTELLDQWSAGLDPGARIIELGAGTGQASHYLMSRGFDLVAVDLSPGNVAKCRERGVPAVVADMAHLEDIRDDQFAPPYDGAFAINSLIHFPKSQLGGALGSIRRALRPGALLMFTLWGGESREGIWEGDWTEPKRFFSFYDEEEARSLDFAGFDRAAFSTLDNRDELGLYSLVFELRAS